MLDYLNTFNHLNMKLFIFVGILQVWKYESLKLRILEILNFTHVTLMYANNKGADHSLISAFVVLYQ